MCPVVAHTFDQIVNEMTSLYKVPKNAEQLKKEIKKKYVGRPQLIAIYKMDYGDHKSANSIKYLKLPMEKDYPLDLNEGYEKHIFRKFFFHNVNLQLVLQWAMSPKGIEFRNECCDKTVVYTRRGTLCKLMLCLLDGQHIFNNLTFRVSRHNGDLYICNNEGCEDNVKTDKKNFHHQRLFQLLFADSVNEYPNTERATDENIQNIILHRSTLAKYELLYSGELYGIESDTNFENFDDIDALNECTFVQSKQIWAKARVDKKSTKNIFWWLHAYLANVKYIYLAEKEWDGKVYKHIRKIPVSRMPSIYKFDPGLLTGFLYKVLQIIENVMADVDSLETTYEFNIDNSSRQINYCAYPGHTDKTFIDATFILHKMNCA